MQIGIGVVAVTETVGPSIPVPVEIPDDRLSVAVVVGHTVADLVGVGEGAGIGVVAISRAGREAIAVLIVPVEIGIRVVAIAGTIGPAVTVCVPARTGGTEHHVHLARIQARLVVVRSSDEEVIDAVAIDIPGRSDARARLVAARLSQVCDVGVGHDGVDPPATLPPVDHVRRPGS